MTRKSSHRSGAPVTLCLILLLSIVFLAPLYHSHDHAADHHPAVNDDHVQLHKGSDHELLAAHEHHSDLHLHIKKDIGRIATHLRVQRSSLNSYLCFVSESPVIYNDPAYHTVRQTQTLILRSNSYDCPSGLSPPAA